MKRLSLVVLFLFVLAGSFLAGSWYNRREYIRTKPSAKESTQVGEGSEDAPSSSVPGTVRITPAKRQVIGVKLAPVERKPVSHTVRVLGRVAPDETKVYRIIATADGWTVDTFNNPTGSLVKKGETLVSVYVPDIVTEEIGYLNWLIGQGRFSTQAQYSTQAVELARQQNLENLKKLGLDQLQIDELTRTRALVRDVLIRAPATGFVTARNISPNQRFEKGTELFRIADLSRVWILADLFENESEYLRPGRSVKVSPFQQGRTFQATVSNILPQFDSTTRTLKVRLESDNPGYVLKPDMFVDLELPVSLPPVITVPADAILDSGLRKTVFVERGGGSFEPREIETGRRIGGRVEVIKGLTPGEKIVLSGNFLIDSESRLELAAAGMVGSLVKDPVCGMDVAVGKAEKAGKWSIYKEQKYYFCSEECKAAFDKKPMQHTKNK